MFFRKIEKCQKNTHFYTIICNITKIICFNMFAWLPFCRTFPNEHFHVLHILFHIKIFVGDTFLRKIEKSKKFRILHNTIENYFFKNVCLVTILSDRPKSTFSFITTKSVLGSVAKENKRKALGVSISQLTTFKLIISKIESSRCFFY